MIKKTLTIAGFDASGGAGIQADLKTFSALKCYGMSVLTALPIQNTLGVSNCYDIPLLAIKEQLISIFEDLSPDAIKIGMLFKKEIIELVSDILKQYAKNIPIVVDPVMLSKSKHILLNKDAIETLKYTLFNLATVITPNIDEAMVLCNQEIHNENDMYNVAKNLLNYSAAVFIKGGHLESTNCSDLLYSQKHCTWFNSKRINSNNTHGTGCTLSAAITANLANGYDLYNSCLNAKKYVREAIQSFANIKLGRGHGPVNHFYHYW